MMSLLARWTALLLLCAASACAQTGNSPVFTTRPQAVYPAAARDKHVTGDAVVEFSISASGATSDVHAISGPEMLVAPLIQEIRGWRFATPLPKDAETDFVAKYSYSIVDPDEQVGEDGKPIEKLDRRVGGYKVAPGPIFAVSGVVQSRNGRQQIDSTPSDTGQEQAGAGEDSSLN